MFWWLAQNTLLAGLLALAAALACRFGRLSPALRHALWLVVLVKLITPPIALYSLPAGDAWIEWLLPAGSLESPHDAAPAAPAAPAAEAPAAEPLVASAGTVEIWTDDPAMDPAAIEVLSAPSEDARAAFAGDVDEIAFAASPPLVETPDLAPAPVGASGQVRIAARSDGSRWMAIRSLLIGVWAIGAAAMALVQLARLIGLRRMLDRTAAAPERLTELVAEIAARLQISAPRVVLTRAGCSPMVCALGRPLLVWPESLAEPLTGEARRAVIAHELAHLRRRDHWIGWLELAASCGWWWNPLFWCVRRQLRENAELACDAWVVSLLPGGRRAYAQALVEVSEMVSWTAAPTPAVGMGASARHLFERRLTMILRERVPCRAPLAGLALIGLLGIAVLPGWTKGQAPPSDEAAAPKEKPEQAAAERSPGAADLAPAERRNPQTAAPAERSPYATPSRRADEYGRSRREADPRPAATREDRESGPRPERAGERRDLGFPIGQNLMQAAERNPQLLQIQQLERQLAELTAAVQALRNDGRLPSDAPHDPNRRAGVDFTAARNPSVVVMDLKQPETEHRIRVHAPGQFRLRLRDDVQVARLDIDKPEVIKLAEQSPHEVVLVAIHPGVAIVKLWDNQDQAYTLHAEVAGGRTDDGLRSGDAIGPARLRYREAAVGRLENAPGRGEFVETLSRVKYKLPQAKAQALAGFLQEHVGGDVETKVDGETLTVTASPDAQARIGQFIELLDPAARRPEPPGQRQRSSNNRDPRWTPSVAPAPAARGPAPAASGPAPAVLGPDSLSLPPASSPVSPPPTPATTPGVDAGILPAVPATPAIVPATPGTAAP